MTDNFEQTTPPEANSASRKLTRGFTRRRMMLGSASVAGIAATALVGRAQANTQKAPAPQATTNPKGKFAGKVVLITGATSGIGEGTAYAFAKEGAKVFFCGRRENLGKQVEAKIKGFGGEATYMPADVRKEEDVKAFIDGCVKKYGQIDIAFNNAGIESKPATFFERSLEEWMDLMNTNATGVFLSMKYELPHMLRQGGGVIVNNASVSGHVGFATIAPYSASKVDATGGYLTK